MKHHKILMCVLGISLLGFISGIFTLWVISDWKFCVGSLGDRITKTIVAGFCVLLWIIIIPVIWSIIDNTINNAKYKGDDEK